MWKVKVLANCIVLKPLYIPTYIPETNHVSRVYIVAAILWLTVFMLHINLFPMFNGLYFHNSTFRIVSVLCSSLISRFPGMLFGYFLNYFEMVPVDPVTTGIIFYFMIHMRCISIVRSLYFRIFSASFFISVSGNCNIITI